ncbi:NUDIX domain-containing protein [Candidatus Woesearchaeota archaeon]|nr:NUDIX domain-containing protein [Candidatus Woesearchaeota archaeon]
MEKFIVVLTAIVLHPDNTRILIVKRKEDEEIHGGKWMLPGGKLEEDESLFDALKREILEETGIEIENEKEYINDYIFERPTGELTLGMTFLIRAINDDVKLNMKEYDDFAWIATEELDEYDYLEYIKPEIDKAFKLL